MNLFKLKINHFTVLIEEYRGHEKDHCGVPRFTSESGSPAESEFAESLFDRYISDYEEPFHIGYQRFGMIGVERAQRLVKWLLNEYPGMTAEYVGPKGTPDVEPGKRVFY